MIVSSATIAPRPVRPPSTHPSPDQAPASLALMRHAAAPEAEKGVAEVLGGHPNVRELVRLLQCTRCSRLFRNPVTLPCGASLCRECLPPPYQRENISYPYSPSRRLGIKCPFVTCSQEHALDDCNVDVILTKIMESIATVVLQYSSTLAEGIEVRVEAIAPADEKDDDDRDADTMMTTTAEESRSRLISGGTFMATYALAVQGQLGYDTDLKYSQADEAATKVAAVDATTVHESLEAAKREVECQVCYALLLNPVTTHCGHTLCRVCLARVLDHAPQCPVCRRALTIAPSLSHQPNNATLSTLLRRSWPEQHAARAAAVEAEERDVHGQTFPLFVVTLAFPHHTTFLRIFEPRYRLMLRRCLAGERQFGLVMHNRYFEPQAGDEVLGGSVPFFRYGTMVRIARCESLPSGESIVELQGTWRFRVTSHHILDGYSVGSVERVEDMDLADEERLEAEETSMPPATVAVRGGAHEETEAPAAEAEAPADSSMREEELQRMSTHALLTRARAFIARGRARSSRFLHQSILSLHGEPPEDAVRFCWWFAAVMPLQDAEKYKLLPTRSVRERLKLIVGWVRRIEESRWYYNNTNNNSCRIL